MGIRRAWECKRPWLRCDGHGDQAQQVRAPREPPRDVRFCAHNGRLHERGAAHQRPRAAERSFHMINTSRAPHPM